MKTVRGTSGDEILIATYRLEGRVGITSPDEKPGVDTATKDGGGRFALMSSPDHAHGNMISLHTSMGRCSLWLQWPTGLFDGASLREAVVDVAQ